MAKKRQRHILRSTIIAGIAILAAASIAFSIFDVPEHILSAFGKRQQPEWRQWWENRRAAMSHYDMNLPSIVVLFGAFWFLMHREMKKAWKETAECDVKIETLETQIKAWNEKHPKLTVTFRDNDDKFFRGGWFFIVLSQDSVGSTVDDAGASIVGLVKIGKHHDEPAVPIGSVDQRPFPWVLGTNEMALAAMPENPAQPVHNPRFNLNPDVRRPILIASYVAERNQIRLGGYGWSGGLYLEKGAYRIHINATGYNARADEIRLVVGLNDDGKLICEIDKSHPSPNRQAAQAAGGDHPPD